MKKFLFFTSLLLLLNFAGRTPLQMEEKIKKFPPKIIRTCCAFGSDLGVALIPFKKMTDVTDVSQIGSHVYLGNKQEGNGIIYTKRGGFVDLGHLRDIADWTAFLHRQIIQNKGNTAVFPLGREGGKKVLTLNIPSDITKKQAVLLAGQIAYDLSNWHEIGTWFGTSLIPLIPERYSAFSPEDQYSNLLGANMGIQALQKDEPFELSMTQLVNEMLTDLEAVPTREKTLAAMEKVNGYWWTREKKLPSKKILLKRYITSALTLMPWSIHNTNEELAPIHSPSFYDSTLSSMYELQFDLNRKFPFQAIFPNRNSRIITQNDFPAMMEFIKIKTDLLHYKTIKKLENKSLRQAARRKRKAT